jgi:glucose-1-phosphate cytidylyltransferase
MGMRLREQTEYIPKPLVEIGAKPILWHIMKIYSHYGYDDFVLCLGYKGKAIRDYLLNYEYMLNDFTIKLGGKRERMLQTSRAEDWTVTCVDTGLNTMTGGRIRRIERFVGDRFLVTYGDNLSDVNILKLVDSHKRMGKIATLTTVHPTSRFGDLTIDSRGIITSFSEKPDLRSWINGGFFVFEKKIFEHLYGDDCVLERTPFETLARERQLAAYMHEGNWYCMDTYRDYTHLNELWDSDKAGWKVW